MGDKHNVQYRTVGSKAEYVQRRSMRRNDIPSLSSKVKRLEHYMQNNKSEEKEKHMVFHQELEHIGTSWKRFVI